MLNTEKGLDRYLTLLRNKIRERGYTQLEVQDALGWGRSYISQLLTKQKSLRLDQVLSILSVIGVDASEFYSELYPSTPSPLAVPYKQEGSSAVPRDGEISGLRTLLDGLIKVLQGKGLVTTSELSVANQPTVEI